ncbi:MAG: MASE1 domain-containing protein [Campylobacterales bacterium]|nr:MASE1 domain-containing protein [Campylobacterales bacterium]
MIKILFIAVIYFISAKMVAPLSLVESGSVFAIWPPTGIALASLCLFGYRIWPGIFIGALALNMTLTPFLPSVQIALTNTVGPLFGFWLLQRYTNKNIFDTTKAMVLFFLSIIMASFITAFGGILALWIHSLVPQTAVVRVWVGWFLGDLIGFLLITPILVSIRSESTSLMRLFSIEGILMLILLGLTSLIIFGPLVLFNLLNYPVVYFLLPPLIWGALRFGSVVAVISLLVVALASIYGTIMGYGPFLRDDPNQSLLLLQSFNGMLAITILLMAAIFRERELVQDKLRSYQENLEQRIDDRTRKLADANNKLIELDRLKTLFIASMSHELRTPLNAIIGFSGVLKTEMTGPLNEKQKEYLERIHKAGKHLLTMIIEVIDISKLESGELPFIVEKFSLKELLTELMAGTSEKCRKKGIESALLIGEDIYLTTDRSRLKQSIKNYLSNAIKFSEKGTITLRARRSSYGVEIEVSDEGIGIESQDFDKLFQPFERLESRLKVLAGGAGLGLYLTKKIVTELMNGEVYFRSEPEIGSTFGLRIPIMNKVVVEKSS